MAILKANDAWSDEKKVTSSCTFIVELLEPVELRTERDVLAEIHLCVCHFLHRHQVVGELSAERSECIKKTHLVMKENLSIDNITHKQHGTHPELGPGLYQPALLRVRVIVRKHILQLRQRLLDVVPRAGKRSQQSGVATDQTHIYLYAHNTAFRTG